MRASVLVPAPQAGLGLPDARALRVRVTADGAVEVAAPDGRTQVASPGEVTRCVILDGNALSRSLRRRTVGASDALALFAGGRPALLVHLHEFVPRITMDGRDLRRTSGAKAVADALGLVLEPAEKHEVSAIDGSAGRAALVSPPTTPVGRPVVTWVAVLVAALLGFLSWVGGGAEFSVVLVALALAAFIPVAVGYVVRRRRFLEITRPPDPAGRRVVPTRLERAEHGGLADAQLQVGPDDVVLHDRGSESWVLGPSHGGITRCVIGSDVVRLTDDEDHDLLVLDRHIWCPGPEDEAPLLAACEAAGIRCEITPMSVQRREPVPIIESADRHVDRLMTPWQHGGVTALLPTSTFFAGAVVLVGATLTAIVTPWSWPLLLLTAVAVATPVASSWAVRRWSARQRPSTTRRSA